MKKSRFIIILGIVALAFMAQLDEDLSEDATNLIKRLEPNDESESYLFLFGIFAKDSENPREVGRKLLEEYQKLDADELYDVDEYPESKRLPLPKGDEFCRSWEDGCLEYLFSAKVNADALLKEHSVLVSRANKFLEFDEFRTLSKPSMNERFPPYRYLSAAERIKTLAAISIYKNGNPSRAIEALSLQLSKLRTSLALQDNLIGKLVFLAKLAEIVDISSIILSETGIRAEMITGLNQAEKSFYRVAAREFGTSYHLFKNLDKHPDFFKIGGKAPGWIIRMVFKPNMTINAITPAYYRVEHLAQLSPSEFASEIATENYVSPSTSKLRNYLGDMLIQISPDFDTYLARFIDIDTKLALFNQIHHLNLSPDNMKNPYYGNEVPKEIDGSFCFSGPLEDKRLLRCLRVKL